MKFIKFVTQGGSQNWLIKVVFIALSFVQISHGQFRYSNACRSIQGKRGTCVPLATCPLFSGWLKQRPLVKQNLKLLVRYTCFFDNEHPKVCCPNDSLFEQEDAFNFRFGNNRRAINHTPRPITRVDNKLVFPTPSLTFPTDSDNHKKVKPPPHPQIIKESDEIELGNRGEFPREHVPLSFPTEPQPFVGQTEKSKSVWSGVSKSSSKQGLSAAGYRKDYRLHPNFHLIPNLRKCSNAAQLNSLSDTYGVYPWIALIGMKRKRSLDFEHVCAGAIINSRYIVTSAHCFRPTTPKYVRLGEYNLDTLIDDGSDFLPQSRREDYRIEKITIHPDYDPRRGVNDIALIRIDKELPFNTTFIQPICLPFLREFELENQIDLNHLEGTTFWVAGWGRHSWDGYSTGTDSSILQEGFAEYSNHEKCRQDYPYLNLTAFSSRAQICVGGKGKRNSCVSDSGGALMKNLKVPGRAGFTQPKFFLFGVLSRGPTGKMCQMNSDEGRSLPTSVFTGVSKYLSFILDNLKE